VKIFEDVIEVLGLLEWVLELLNSFPGDEVLGNLRPEFRA
jgi:hypothetical protein